MEQVQQILQELEAASSIMLVSSDSYFISLGLFKISLKKCISIVFCQ